jgi:hypothetical protein
MANSSKKKSSSGFVVNVVVLLALVGCGISVLSSSLHHLIQIPQLFHAQIATLERAVFDAWGNQWTILSGDALNFFFITLCYIGLVFENRSIQWTVSLLRLFRMATLLLILSVCSSIPRPSVRYLGIGVVYLQYRTDQPLPRRQEDVKVGVLLLATCICFWLTTFLATIHARMLSGLVDFKQGTVSYWETSNQAMNPNTIEIIHAAVQLAMTVSFLPHCF